MADEGTAPNPESEQGTQPEGPPQGGLSLLANDMFGPDFYGEVKRPEESGETPTGEETPEAESPETPEEGEQPESPESEEAEYSEYQLGEIAQLLGVEEGDLTVDDDGKVAINLKVDGETSHTRLSDLKAREQQLQAADKRLEEAKEKAKAQNQELSQKSEALQEQFATAAKLIENAESVLDQDTKAIDWNKLRQDDPAEYSAKKAEIAERRQQLEQMKEDAKKTWQESVQKQREQLQEQQKQHLQSEHAALLEKLPEWQDAEKAQSEKSKISEYLKGTMGFSDEDVMGASDHRLILMARKAMLYDELQANTDVARKKVAKVPKVMKPGTPKSPDQRNKEQERKARDQLKKSGSLNDAYALLKARRGGN